MGGQLDLLHQRVSKLSPEAQKAVYSGLQSGKYGSINIYAKEQGGDYAKAKQYLDEFFSSAEGRRYETGQTTQKIEAQKSGFSSVAEYQSIQGFAGNPTKKDLTSADWQKTPTQNKPVYGPQQQFVVGYDTQGNAVYSTTKPETPYKSPSWFGETSAKKITQVRFVSDSPSYGTISSQPVLEYKQEEIKGSINPEAGRVQEKEDAGFLSRSQTYLSQKRDFLHTESARSENKFNYEAESVGIGFASSVVGSATFFKSLAIEPIETTKAIPSGVKQTYYFFERGKAAKVIRQESGFSVGYVAGEVAVLKGTGEAGKLIGKGYGYSRTAFETSIKTEIPTEELKTTIQPFSRQRATVLLRESGSEKYILGVNQENIAISIGGGIEKGQTARAAALSELGQETGLKLKDLGRFEFKEKIIFPEETHYVYTAEISDISRIRPASDIKRIIKISPGSTRGITGQTKFSPVAKKVSTGFLKRERVRSYELGIINRIETGQETTFLALETKQGEKFYLGTQSRYNVPFSSQSKYLKEETLTLAHGTQKAPAIENFISGQKEFSIDPRKSARGAAKGLYVQPPVSAGKIIGKEGYFGLSYAGVGIESSEGMKFGFTRPNRAFYTFNEAPKYPIAPTPKTFAGSESELIIKEGTIQTIGQPQKVFIEGRSLRIQQAEIAKGSVGVEKNIVNNFKRGPRIDYRLLSYRYITPGDIAERSVEILSFSKPGASFYFQRERSLSYQLREIASSPRAETRNSIPSPYLKLVKSRPLPSSGSFSEFSSSKTLLPSSPILKLPGNQFGNIFPKLNKVISYQEEETSKVKLFPQPKKYQPTLSAAALNIKAPKIPKSYKLGAGGIAQRPLISGGKKRR